MHFIPDCNARPVETWRTNVLGTACVVETATRHSVPRLIFASSGAIYQSQPDPLVESAPLSSSDVYARTKEAAERVCGFYASRFPLGCIIARLFNTYGPREKVPHLIPHVLKSAQAGTEIPLGNLSSKRDYIYVEDTAEALLQMLAQPKFAPVANIGSGRQYSAAEVVAQVAKLTGRDLRIRTEAGRLRAVDKPFQVANVDVMLKTYGWAPKFSLEEGLAELIRTMDGRLTADGRSS
jgi:nucleoside-diphosphate-sugar epimerase